jgi:type II secretory pathway pseudopilin PulG
MMKSGVIGAVLLLAFALPAVAGSQKQADMEDALRQQQLICSGMLDVAARGGGYTGHQFAQCLVTLEAQKADYQRYMATTAFSGK